MIFDCFPFFNELDLLEIRLNELSDIVDVFVLSEATLTFTGKKKPLYYLENKERFYKFADRIHHIVIDSYDGINTSNPWSMDRGQKQIGIDFLQKSFRLNKDDVVILSDCDEIPKAENIKKALTQDWDRMAIQMRIFYYYLNCMCINKQWYFPQIIRPEKEIQLSKIRGKRFNKKLSNGGWHFSYLTNIKQKLDSFAHSELNILPYNRSDWIKRKREAGQDLFNRKLEFEFLADFDYLPKHVKSNMQRFKKYIKLETDHAS